MKLLPFISLFFIALLAAPSLASSTPLSDNSTIIENTTIVKELPTEQYLLNNLHDCSKDSSIIDNTTLEVAMVAKDKHVVFDSYKVYTQDSSYNVTCWYTQGNPFGRIETYVDCGGIYQVTPAPMAIKKPLKMWPFEKNAKEFSTCPVKSYKITFSYFGTPVITDPVSPPEENNETTQPVENTTTPVNDKPVMILDNSTIINASGNQTDDSMYSVENSTGMIKVQGNGNSIQQIILDLKNLDFSNAKIDTINFFINR